MGLVLGRAALIALFERTGRQSSREIINIRTTDDDLLAQPPRRQQSGVTVRLRSTSRRARSTGHSRLWLADTARTRHRLVICTIPIVIGFFRWELSELWSIHPNILRVSDSPAMPGYNCVKLFHKDRCHDASCSFDGRTGGRATHSGGKGRLRE